MALCQIGSCTSCKWNVSNFVLRKFGFEPYLVYRMHINGDNRCVEACWELLCTFVLILLKSLLTPRLRLDSVLRGR